MSSFKQSKKGSIGLGFSEGRRPFRLGLGGRSKKKEDGSDENDEKVEISNDWRSFINNGLGISHITSSTVKMIGMLLSWKESEKNKPCGEAVVIEKIEKEVKEREEELEMLKKQMEKRKEEKEKEIFDLKHQNKKEVDKLMENIKLASGSANKEKEKEVDELKQKLEENKKKYEGDVQELREKMDQQLEEQKEALDLAHEKTEESARLLEELYDLEDEVEKLRRALRKEPKLEEKLEQTESETVKVPSNAPDATSLDMGSKVVPVQYDPRELEDIVLRKVPKTKDLPKFNSETANSLVSWLRMRIKERNEKMTGEDNSEKKSDKWHLGDD